MRVNTFVSYFVFDSAVVDDWSDQLLASTLILTPLQRPGSSGVPRRGARSLRGRRDAPATHRSITTTALATG